MQEFLKRLLISRKKLGTQREVAQKSNIHQSAISRYEKADSTSYEYEFLKYLAQQGIDLNWLFTGEVAKNSESWLVDKLTDSYETKFEGLELKINSLNQMVHVRDQKIYFLEEEVKELKAKLSKAETK